MKYYNKISKELDLLSNKDKAKILQGYFKTGKGEYGEGDVFLGITVPLQRKVAKTYIDSDFEDIEKLLKSKIHEYRFTALEILVLKYEKCKKLFDTKGQKDIADFYLKNTKYINNWDLVDTSARYILGDYLFEKDRSILYKLAISKNLWERRISIISTHYFIYKKEYKDTFAIAEILLNDKHDLIHKAVGWMLREIGKNISKDIEKEFLDKNASKMPRIMLSYSLEHFNKQEKIFYKNK